MTHNPATCTWDADPGELWEAQPCLVEGCRFEQTDEDGCGLARLQTVREGLARWDAGDPVQRGCLASRRAEDALEHWDCARSTR